MIWRAAFLPYVANVIGKQVPKKMEILTLSTIQRKKSNHYKNKKKRRQLDLHMIETILYNFTNHMTTNNKWKMIHGRFITILSNYMRNRSTMRETWFLCNQCYNEGQLCWYSSNKYPFMIPIDNYKNKWHWYSGEMSFQFIHANTSPKIH